MFLKKANWSNRAYFSVTFIVLYISISYLRVEQQVFNFQDYPKVSVFQTLSVQQMEDTTCAGILKGQSSQRNIATEQDRQNSASLFTFIRGSSPNFGVQTAIETSQYKDLYMAVGEVSIPWIILLIISIFGWLSFIMCCTCEACCPPCKCCRRDVVEKPYTSSELSTPLIFLGLFSLIIIAVSIPGIIYASGLSDGIKSTRCAFFAGTGDLINLQDGTSWPGLYQINLRMLNLSGGINNFVNLTNNTFSTKSDGFKKNLTQLLKDNQNINQQIILTQSSTGTVQPYESYYSKNGALNYLCNGNLPSDAIFTQSLMKRNITPQDPLFNSTYNTIIAGFQLTEVVSGQILQNTDAFVGAIQNGSLNVQQTLDNLTTKAQTFYNTTQTANDISNYLDTGALVLYGFALFSSTMAIISIFLLGLKQKYWARHIIHFIWFTYGIIVIIGFVIVAVLFPINGVLIETCSYIQGMITVRANLDNQQLIDGQGKSLLLECLYDGGDILKTFNLTTAIQQISNISLALSNFTGILTQFNLLNVLMTGALLNNNVFLTSFGGNNLIVDNGPSGGVNNLMSQFNQHYSKGNGCANDIFAMDQSGCGSTVFDSNLRPSNSDKDSLKCLGGGFLNTQKFDLTDRYSTCGTQSNDYRNLVNFFYNQNSQWTPIIAAEFSVLDSNQINLLAVNNRTQGILNYITNTSQFLNDVTDPKVGLQQGLNCSFLNVTVNRFYDAICVNLVPSLWKTQLLLAILCVSMLLACCCGCCAATRFAKVSQIKYQDDANGNFQQNEQTGIDVNIKQHKYINPNAIN